ncbi:MAG: sodium-dependent bicarbonate transport family permease [Tagaea sp.]|nr:sodium-dependent bicarbonate transport family permease [Azospirillum sp.]MCA3266666.1 sodium-dependent bicarbonate transport family permease [Azospirillum sp.]MCZ8122880.1 sodium-dependent bicarbonate transport family permease [Magnetospirillum sp.]
MSTLEIVRLNLLSPMVLSFALGAIAHWVRSDLKFPDQIYAAMSIYLLFAIGLKGGAALSEASFATVAGAMVAGIGLGIAIPLWSFAILRKLGKFGVEDAAAIAAHYGSVSAVTFIAATAYMQSLGTPAEGFMPAVLAAMEVPAIVVALLLAKVAGSGDSDWRAALPEVLAGKSIVLLAGGLAVGFLAGTSGYQAVAPFFAAPFQGVLCLFLLDMGMVAARRLADFKRVGPFLLGFAVIMPVVHGALGVWLGASVGLSVGGATVLGVLAASASYIAAPAAVRIALPDASPGYYLTASLAITFPFNLVVGLPVYLAFAQYLVAGAR